MNKFSEGLVATGLVLFIFLSEPGYVNGLSCFECTSFDGTSCQDSLNRKVIIPTNCNSSIFTLWNNLNEEFICISTKEENSTHTFYARRCGLKSEESICKTVEERGADYNLTKCHTCQEDLCNASIVNRVNLFIIVFTFVNCINLIKHIL